MKTTFFKSPSELRAWFDAHHETAKELWLGFHKKSSGKPSITWPEAVDEALSVGWIDGVRKRIDDLSYTIRFTPRKSKSIWSNVNVKRAKELTRLGRMRPAGVKAYQARKKEKSGVYSYEQKRQGLDPGYLKRLKASKDAWRFFNGQPPWYQRAASHWVMSAKREETRLRRLETLLDDSQRGRTVAPLTRPTG